MAIIYGGSMEFTYGDYYKNCKWDYWDYILITQTLDSTVPQKLCLKLIKWEHKDQLTITWLINTLYKHSHVFFISVVWRNCLQTYPTDNFLISRNSVFPQTLSWSLIYVCLFVCWHVCMCVSVCKTACVCVCVGEHYGHNPSAGPPEECGLHSGTGARALLISWRFSQGPVCHGTSLFWGRKTLFDRWTWAIEREWERERERERAGQKER